MDIVKILGRIVIFVAAYTALNFGTKSWSDSRESSAGDAAIETVNQAFDEVLEQNPNATGIDKSEAIRQTSVDRVGELVGSQTDDNQKRTVAIDAFGGFLYVNIVLRPEYCHQFGVDLTAFVNAFTTAHEEEIKIAEHNGVNFKTLYRNPEYARVMKEIGGRVIQIDMEGVQQELAMTEAESCQLLNEAAAEVVSGMHISVTQPDVYAAMRL